MFDREGQWNLVDPLQDRPAPGLVRVRPVRPELAELRRRFPVAAGAGAQLKHRSGREEGAQPFRLGVAEVRDRPLDPFAPDQPDQEVGGRVVADRDHLLRGLTHADLGAVRLVLQGAGGQAARFRRHADRVVPAQRPGRNLVGDGGEHVQLERRTNRRLRVDTQGDQLALGAAPLLGDEHPDCAR